ncbi:hypothetical protein SYNPS1DRAFT_27834 [Syncephalis pseudoplumigaleata]|uniref:RRM domain-containing protein n=1 Tax=Syncephalis pseudoplumigaleata TaxID=1712513 RepID=A0A4P9Z4I3_9FUNG|nr:hypothetical protein SYNPS1DRAFT_27834 [Syncephalis pseudoplumigaleata]|eukprot:RKP26470.1 hypothetical protein SYNPS1DRAFT_27834 [Syncephalis pseudoplumigaleata]
MADKKSKKKPVKMALTDFLTSTPSSTSWADEVLELPTRPASSYVEENDDQSASGGGRGGYNDRYAHRGERSERYPRERRPPAPLPDEPPFTAYIGNLPFDLKDEDVETFFGSAQASRQCGDMIHRGANHSGVQINNIRIIRDFNDRPKGFGYVEFADRDALAAAVERDGQTINGRNIRVNVAEPPKERFGGHAEDKTNVDSWRRTTSIESPRRTTFGERADSPRRHHTEGGRYGRRDDDPRRPVEPSPSDTAVTWRRQEPLERSGGPLSPGMGGGERRRGWGFNRHGDQAGEDRSYSGGRFRGGEDRDGMRSPFSHSRRTSIESRGSGYGDGGSTNSPRPVERKKLELKPRTLPLNPEPASPSSSSSSTRASRPNPFGAAKPRDENEMLRRVEERHQQRKAEVEKVEPKEEAKEEASKDKAEASAEATAANGDQQ